MVRKIQSSVISKVFWCLICILVIIWACKINVVTLSNQQTEKILEQKRLNYTKELNETELNEFIVLYPKFKADMLSYGVDIDYIREYPDSADWATKRWFMYQFWDIKRFFYVQKRAEGALAAAEERQKAVAVAKQLENREDEISQALYEAQKAKVNELGEFTLNEMNLAEKNAKVLKELFY